MCDVGCTNVKRNRRTSAKRLQIVGEVCSTSKARRNKAIPQVETGKAQIPRRDKSERGTNAKGERGRGQVKDITWEIGLGGPFFFLSSTSGKVIATAVGHCCVAVHWCIDGGVDEGRLPGASLPTSLPLYLFTPHRG